MPRPKAFDREDILEKAMRLFWQKGFHGTSVQDLVDHLGINRSTMYASFGDKNQLFLDSLKYYRSRQKEVMKETIGKKASFRSFLDSFLKDTIEEILTDPDRKGCFIVNASVDRAAEDPQACSELQHNLREFTDTFSHLMNVAKEDKEIAPHTDTEKMAQFLYNTISGMRVLGRTNPPRHVLENIREVTLQTILKGGN
ncbi:TetR/AcrR family transcriptional regulator [Roseivirga sp. BDSF3-8]|uniref:TetR/AcrR family transcriptional regulator n=1 Tax=Roseivirga sp. BDSF3-8 TaxID=3241598 RepID=UPI00353234C7